MKNISRWIVAGAAVLGLSVTAQAEMLDGKPYMRFDAGANFIQDTEIKDSGGQKAKFDTGFRGDVAFGYTFCETMSAEFQTGLLYNSIDSLGFASLDRFDSDGSLYQFPLMVNGIYTVPLKGCVRPYIGAGLGGVVGVFDLDTPVGDFSDSDFTFGYQAMAGVKMQLNENLELGIGYKFLGTTDHKWSDGPDTLRTEDLFNHAVLATIHFEF